jgi:hypothetical protein
MAEATAIRVNSPSHQAYQILHMAFTVAPIIAGADKFFHFLANWDLYLAPVVSRTLGISAHTFMLGVGAIEIIAGLLVALTPRIGAWVVGLWLCGIIVNLLFLGMYFDVALRDLGLALSSFALARLSVDYQRT